MMRRGARKPLYWLAVAAGGAVVFAVLALVLPASGLAQELNFNFGEGGSLTGQLMCMIALLTIISLALFLTAFIMMPTLQQSYREGIAPLITEEISEEEAFDRTVGPLRTFMLRQVREEDLAMFLDLTDEGTIASPEDTPLRALVPAFMISELRRAFEIGFLIFIPFLVIDMVVAGILLSMGMMMLPPVMISLPFKLIFFVLVDGWMLLSSSLVDSFTQV